MRYLAVFLLAACGGPPAAPPDPALPVHLPDIVAPPCDPKLIDGVVAAAREAATCSADADCGVRNVGVCNVEGVGCYFAVVNPARPAAPLDAAIAAYQSGGCPLAKCDCPMPPTRAVCRDGQCVAAPAEP